MRQLISAIAGICLCATAAFGQALFVKVTVPKANVRSEPSDKAPILQQATPNDQIEWRATEGDWFKVLMPPNPALGGARVEAYISKKVSKLLSVAAIPASSAPVETAPAVPKLDTHAANVFLGSIVDGTLLKQTAVVISPSGNRQWWTVQNSGDWMTVAERRPSFVVSIGDRAGFAAAGLAPVIVRLAKAPNDVSGVVIGSTKGDKDWKSDEVSTETSQGAAGVWDVKLSKDLKPGDYAIVMRPLNSKAAMPEIAWAFTVK